MVKIVLFLIIFFPTIAQANIRDGLVGWWKMDEGSGTTTADSSGQGNTGTLINTPIWVNGIKGGAISFNGSNQYVTAATSGLPSGTASRTLSGWIYITQYLHYNIGFCYGGAGGGAIFGYYLNGSTLNFWGNGDDINTGYTISLNQWQNIAITYDGSNVSMYVNGVQVLAPTAPPFGLNTGTTNVLIGKSQNNDYFPGIVDDVRIYNRVLSDQEMINLYKSDIQIRNASIKNAKINN